MQDVATHKVWDRKYSPKPASYLQLKCELKLLEIKNLKIFIALHTVAIATATWVATHMYVQLGEIIQDIAMQLQLHIYIVFKTFRKISQLQLASYIIG